MKPSLCLCLASLLFVARANAAQSVTYPEKDPLIGLSFPDDWVVETKKGTLYGHPENDAGLFLELAPLETSSADPEAAITEVKGLIEEDFKDVTYSEPQKGGGDGVGITVINAKGVDEDGKANLNLFILEPKGAPTLLLLKCISSQEAFEKHGEVLPKIIDSLQAIGPEEAAIQTYSYPDKQNPSYSVDFPADWKLESTDEGAYVESPDQLVAMNVIMIDRADVDVAVETMKKKVGEKYASITWNGGGEPHVVKDDALGVTATFNNGVAVDDKGIKYSVNFAQYVKTGADKFFLLLCQEPLKALETHGDAVEKIVRSIKVK